jgi:hypothetical protein
MSGKEFECAPPNAAYCVTATPLPVQEVAQRARMDFVKYASVVSTVAGVVLELIDFGEILI